MLALLAHHFLHVSRITIKSLHLRLLMSYIYGAHILDVSRSHTTTHHSRYDSSGRVISSLQRPLPDNTRHSQQTNIHAPGGIRTHDLSRRAATGCAILICFNPLNAELNPICYLLALLAHHFLHVSRIMVKTLTLRLLMSYIYIYIYGAPILDVSRSHTTTQQSR